MKTLIDTEVMLTEREQRIARQAYQAGYGRGHNDTVEGCYNGSCEEENECADEWIEDWLKTDGGVRNARPRPHCTGAEAMIFSLTDTLGVIAVSADNGIKAGEILMGDDGFYQFWPEHRAGYWPSYAMREIADKVDSMNATWKMKIEEELNK